MNTKNFLIAGIVGGLAYFLMGWLIYGMLMMEYTKPPVEGLNRGEEDMLLWAVAVGNLFSGFLMAYIFGKANVKTAGSGLTTGGMIGLLLGCSYGLLYYGVSNMYADLTHVAVEIAIGTVMSAIGGAIIGALMGMGNKSAT